MLWLVCIYVCPSELLLGVSPYLGMCAPRVSCLLGVSPQSGCILWLSSSYGMPEGWMLQFYPFLLHVTAIPHVSQCT